MATQTSVVAQQVRLRQWEEHLSFRRTGQSITELLDDLVCGYFVLWCWFFLC